MVNIMIRQWEHQLLELAYMGLEHQPTPSQHLPLPPDLLRRAYAKCDEITRLHSKTFHLASSLMPAEKRCGIRALYAFCRTTDDMVDQRVIDAPTLLEAWREKAFSGQSSTQDLTAIAWHDTRHRFNIPRIYAEQLMHGVAQDLRLVRYAHFSDLAAYCYSVASTVGLMSMHITGYASREAIPYAVRLGVALQLTNILRDIGEDWRMGRVYLPLDELDSFGLGEDDIEAGCVTSRWREFMRFQIARNRELYRSSLPGVRLLNADGRFAVAAAGELYQHILADIEAHDYDVFTRRAFTPRLTKLRSLPGIWWRARINTYT